MDHHRTSQQTDQLAVERPSMLVRRCLDLILKAIIRQP
jgi:hypothetical protein